MWRRYEVAWLHLQTIFARYLISIDFDAYSPSHVNLCEWLCNNHLECEVLKFTTGKQIRNAWKWFVHMITTSLQCRSSCYYVIELEGILSVDACLFVCVCVLSSIKYPFYWNWKICLPLLKGIYWSKKKKTNTKRKQICNQNDRERMIQWLCNSFEKSEKDTN